MPKKIDGSGLKAPTAWAIPKGIAPMALRAIDFRRHIVLHIIL